MPSVPYVVECLHRRMCEKRTITSSTSWHSDGISNDTLMSDLTDVYVTALFDWMDYDVEGEITQEKLNNFFTKNGPLKISYFTNQGWHDFKIPSIPTLSRLYDEYKQ